MKPFLNFYILPLAKSLNIFWNFSKVFSPNQRYMTLGGKISPKKKSSRVFYHDILTEKKIRFRSVSEIFSLRSLRTSEANRTKKSQELFEGKHENGRYVFSIFQ